MKEQRRFARIWGANIRADVDDEVRLHLDLKKQELMRRGFSESEAEREAARAFGDVTRVSSELHELGRRRERRLQRAGRVDELRTDLKHAWRLFTRRPGVPLVAVVTLALGIGAGTAVFSLFDAVVLNPVPVERPQELLSLYEGRPGERTGGGFSFPMLATFEQHATLVRGVAGSIQLGVGVRAGAHAEQASAAMVSGSYFDLLGVRPRLGRMLQSYDADVPGSAPHAVLSHAFWLRAFGGTMDALGATIVVNETPFTVVGVAPPHFRGTHLASPVDVWLPATMLRSIGGGGMFSAPNLYESWYFNVVELVARLPAGAAPEPALDELNALYAAAMEEAPPREFSFGEPETAVVVAMPFTEAAAARSRAELLRFLTVLAAVVAIGLAIACVNVANLLLMRAAERRRELTVRAAVGANGARLMRQMVVENVALGLCAGALGLLVALACMRLLVGFALPGGIALAELPLELDLRVLGFTLAAALLCTLAFGMAPALSARRADVAASLRETAQGVRNRWRGGSLLLASQVGLSVVLLVAGFLFLRSLQSALSVDLGFRSDGVASAAVGLRQHGYTTDRAGVFADEVLERLRAQPGVAAAGAATRIPIDPDAMRLPVAPAGTPPGAARLPLVSVTPGYFAVFGIPLVRGRLLDERDVAGGQRVAVVTEQAAAALWPGEDPIGREFVVVFGTPYTVVGVVRDAHFTRLGEREPHFFFPLAQSFDTFGGMGRLHFVARGSAANGALAAVRRSIQATDARLPTFHERNAAQQVAAVLMPQRFGLVLLAVFGGIALAISAVGIYAVAAFDVVRRRRELGIRAALGADRVRLVRTVLGRSGRAVGLGAIAGLAAAYLATRALTTLLFGIAHTEPASYAAAAAVLALVAIVASWIPATRAAGVEPGSVMKG